MSALRAPSGLPAFAFLLLLIAAVTWPLTSSAGVLPDDRADVLYHRYEGGGVTIHGPSVLVRKKIAEKYSVSANYYMDFVTSASIDVKVSGASQYKEERKQWNVGFDYLRGKTTYSLGYTDSKENDYHATTASFGLSQDLFGDLTTISMGFSKGADTVQRTTVDPANADRRIVDPTFKEDVDRWSYRVGLSQILTKSLIATLGVETITDEGYLNNPYRAFRYVDPADNTKFRLATEKYPHTHTSNAVALGGRYFLPWRAAVFGSYRFYTDTWGIRSNTGELGYVFPLQNTPWTFEASYRYYQQDHADFYSDLFPRIDFQNFMGRDKELSTFSDQTMHVGATYEFAKDGWSFIKKGTFNVYYDRIQFKFDDFRDASVRSQPAGAEPLYEYGANVYQMFVSIWF